MKLSKTYLICTFLLSLIPLLGISQHCDYQISGTVTDKGPNIPLPYVNVIIQELHKGVLTDENGYYQFDNVCHGDYHLIFSHIGCETKTQHLHLHGDTIVNYALMHSAISLDDIIIEGSNEQDTQFSPSATITTQQIEDQASSSLADITKEISGVSSLSNGSGISKPVVHGLFGNRLLILNNGVPQSGQQWGNDHSPEIDPLAADQITVLKGTSAIEYPGGNLGSLVSIMPSKIINEPHLHGHFISAYESNGRGISLNTKLQKYSPVLAWRVNATYKKYGDRSAPDYFLTNTGSEEWSASLQLEKSWNDKLFVDFYSSIFSTQIGVLRGSHIGNITDLEGALSREVPLFTEQEFSYDISEPRQKVNHYLSKITGNYYFQDNQSIKFSLAIQINDRAEFDIRRVNRSEIPALDLFQFTLDTDLKYSTVTASGWQLKLGQQNTLKDNVNVPGTGVLPLIPNYASWRSGVFASLSKKKNNLSYKFGGRYDFEYQDVRTLTRRFPREVIPFENFFHSAAGTANLVYEPSFNHSFQLGLGVGLRNPAINELYSDGLHQGVSGIEEGSINLASEKSQKLTLEYQWSPSTKFSFSALGYSHLFSDYIFLNPQREFRLTIRGAFPVFLYEQTDAFIAGLDLTSKFTLSESLYFNVRYSFLRGQDLTKDIPLVNMPANNGLASITYRHNEHIHINNFLHLDQLELELNNRYVFRQNNLLDEQDFTPTPPAYNLIGLKISTNLIFPSYKLRLFTSITNLANVQYRDYLNRLRYFGDENGRSWTIGLNVKF